MAKKVLVSGVKPTGRPHIGNYFGAMRQFIEFQETHDCFYFVANYHALTTIRDKKELSQNTFDVVVDYLAAGLDPQKATIFVQSDVPEVTELAWIFNNLVTVPYLERAHAYKDSIANNKEPNVGLFTYPVLMAADILMYNADSVPVGEDQRQHVEYAREIARKFNTTFGETFKEPEELIQESVAVVPGTDGQKMSKSYGNTIPLFATRDEIESAVMGIVTDSEGDVPENVYAIHKLFKNEKELESLYEENKGQYKELKEALVEDIDAFIAPLRERREQIVQDKDAVVQILANGADRASEQALLKMHDVREKVGLSMH